MIAYFGTIMGTKVIAYYTRTSPTGEIFAYHHFAINYQVGGTENSLQFTSNNDLYYLNPATGTVELIKFEPDYCTAAQDLINELWPLLPIEIAGGGAG